MAFLRKALRCGKEPSPPSKCDYHQVDKNGKVVTTQCQTNAIPPKDVTKTIVRFVAMSDTHEIHHLFSYPDQIPGGDVFLHCGDILFADHFTVSSISQRRIKKFFAWINDLPHKTKIVIAGNHDLEMEKSGEAAIKQWASPAIYAVNEIVEVPVCLSSTTTNELTKEDSQSSSLNVLLRCLASPWSCANTRTSPNRAFQGNQVLKSLMTLAASWEKNDRTTSCGHSMVDADGSKDDLKTLDIVMTHQGSDVEPLRTVLETVRPSVHFGGHVHEEHGYQRIGPVPSFNAAMMLGGFSKERLLNVTVVDCEV